MSNWWYVANGERRGPVTNDDLQRLIDGGTLTSNSLVWKQGMEGWQPAGRIDELASLLWSVPPEIPNRSEGMWLRVRRHLGSSIAIAVGCVTVVAGLSTLAQRVNKDDPLKADTLIAGIVMILGAIAYRSAKKRKLGQAKSTLTRYCLEIGSLILICVAILASNDLMYLIETDPVPNLVIPVWAILAYLVVAFVPSFVFRQRRGR